MGMQIFHSIFILFLIFFNYIKININLKIIKIL